VETGIDQGTLYRQRGDDTLTLADAVRERNDRDSWTDLHELLAILVDTLNVMRTEAMLIAGVPRSKLPDPRRVTRPGEKKQETPVLTPGQFARLAVTG
jgi:hypothetical protein